MAIIFFYVMAKAVDKIHSTHLTFIYIIACLKISGKKSKKICKNRLNMLFKCDIVYTILRTYPETKYSILKGANYYGERKSIPAVV